MDSTLMCQKVYFQNIRTHYDALVSSYERRWCYFLAAVREWVFKRLPEMCDGPCALLDAGCGTGVFLKRIHDHNPDWHLVAIEGSPEMAAEARKRCSSAKIIEGDLESPVWPKQKFDVILSLNILHHLNDQTGHLKKLADHVKKDGSVFLCDFAIESLSMKIMEFFWRRWQPTHHKALSSAALEDMIRANDFVIKDRALLRPDWFWRVQIYHLTR